MFNTFLIAVVLLFQDEQPKPLPEIKQLLGELRKTLHTDRELLSQYTYTEKHTRIDYESGQKPKNAEVNVFQVFPGTVGRVGYRRQVVKDGKTLSDEELKKADQEQKKKIESIQRKMDAKTPAEVNRAREERSRREEQLLDDVFGGYDVEIAGREDLEGRPAIVLNFKPRPGYKPKTREGKSMQHIAGRAWISEQDHQLARVEMEVIDSISIGLGILAKLQKGATLKAVRQKFNDEIWLPMRTEVALNARFLLVKGFNLREIVEYSDHKKYSVDTILKFPEIEKLEP